MYFNLKKIGLMQGRLVNSEKKNAIQYFPSKNWKKEIYLLSKTNIKILEWTINRENAKQNPLLSNPEKIIDFIKKKKIKILSVTNDIFMEEPFFRYKNKDKIKFLIDELKLIIHNSKKIGIKFIVLPIVDKGSLKNPQEKKILLSEMKKIKLSKNDPILLFESDMSPGKLMKFIKQFDNKKFGINYDIGNSAFLNYDLNAEKKYFKFVKNVHLKDKNSKNISVRLGEGIAKFDKIFSLLKSFKYNGNFILQTARSNSGDHIGEINKNLKFLKNFFI